MRNWLCEVEDYGAALYYNTALPVPGHPNRVMKYGIISTHALRRDLVDWQWMYAAGAFYRESYTRKGNYLRGRCANYCLFAFSKHQIDRCFSIPHRAHAETCQNS